MKVVPALKPCVRCGVELEAGEGPNGLAYHGCDPRRKVVQATAPASVTALVEAALAREDLTMQEAGLLYARMVLNRMVRDPEGMMGEPGSVLEGMAKFITSRGGQTEGGIEELLRKLQEDE